MENTNIEKYNNNNIIVPYTNQEHNRLTNINYLYQSTKYPISASSFKYSTQKFEMNKLLEACEISEELENYTYKIQPPQHFIINERGKTRHIASNDIRDKVCNRNNCDQIIYTNIKNYLIYDNGASQKGKGISFTRKRFEKHLRDAYKEYGSNDFYILLGDFHNFYGSIPHDKIIKMFKKYVKPNITPEEWKMELLILQQNFKTFNNDIGINIGVDIGNHISQEIGIAYGIPIDNYVKIVKSQKYYARYTDDWYIINKSKELLENILEHIYIIANKLGLTLNEKKTHIVKVSHKFHFLQCEYFMIKTGKLVIKINPKTVTRERRKLKRYKNLLSKGIMTIKEIENSFKSWLGNYYKIMSNKQFANMIVLYYQLFERSPKWKKKHKRLNWLTEQVLRIYRQTGIVSFPIQKSQQIYQTQILPQL